MSTSVLQEIMELPKCEDESGCRWIKADDVFRVIDVYVRGYERHRQIFRKETMRMRAMGINLKEDIADEQKRATRKREFDHRRIDTTGRRI